MINGYKSVDISGLSLKSLVNVGDVKGFKFNEAETLLVPEQNDICLADFVEETFVHKLHEWQRKHLCPALERCKTEKGLRLAIHKPPQYGGSVIVSQRLAPWLWGTDPTHRFGLMCYNETHSVGFGQVIKQILNTEDYQRLFPHIRVKSDAPAGKFFNTHRLAMGDGQPSFIALGLSSGFVGRSVDTLVIDDPYKNREDAFSPVINNKIWRMYEETIDNRIAPESNIIVMFHRWHENDFAGRLLATGKYECLRFPAIADENADNSDPTGRAIGELLSPIRPLKWVEEKLAQNPAAFYSLFQGVPRSESGRFFKREDFIRWEDCDEYDGTPEPKLDLWVRAWDLAASSSKSADWTVGVMAGITAKGQLCIRDIVKAQDTWGNIAPLIDEVTEADVRWCKEQGARYEFGIEAVLTQSSFWNDFNNNRSDGSVPLHKLRKKGEDKDKKSHASGWQARGRAIKTVVCNTSVWDYEAYLAEVLSFTGLKIDKNDDHVDATSYAYQLIYDVKGGKMEEEQPIAQDTHAFYDELTKRAAQAKQKNRFRRL